MTNLINIKMQYYKYVLCVMVSLYMLHVSYHMLQFKFGGRAAPRR